MAGKPLIGFAILVAAICAPFVSNASNHQCARSQFAAALSLKYNETPLFLGLSDDGTLLEVFASEAKQTWTLLVSPPDGCSWVLSEGEGWAYSEPGSDI